MKYEALFPPAPIGFCFSVQHGQVFTASKIDKSWIGTNAELLFSSTGCPACGYDADKWFVEMNSGMAEIKMV